MDDNTCHRMTSADVYALARQIKAISQQHDDLIARIAEAEDTVTGVQRALNQEIVDRLYALANLMDMHGSRHDLEDAAIRRQSTTISEMWANSDYTVGLSAATESRHDKEIASLRDMMRDTNARLDEIAKMSRRHGTTVKWVAGLALPTAGAFFAAVAELVRAMRNNW